MINVINMRCGYYENPLCVDRNNVSFSWSTQGAVSQVAYRLQIAHDSYFKSIYVDTHEIASSNNKFINIKAKLSKNSRYYWRVKVYSSNGHEAWSDVRFFETENEKFKAKWITAKSKRNPSEPSPSSRFRREFEINGEIKSAKLFASAQGLYVASLNGKKCGNEYLTPGWTEYKSRIQYQIYDVKNLILQGLNCLAATVSDGWFMGPLSPSDDDSRCKFGTMRAFFAQLEITYMDDTSQTLITDSSWYSDMNSPYRRCEIYYGADYDSRIDDDFELVSSYNKPNSQEISIPGKLVPMQGVPVKEIRSIVPIELIITKNGETVLDMGQYITGTVEISVSGTIGQEIEILLFEALNEQGCVYSNNLGSARQGINYILKSGENTFIPEMTFFGFRYIHVVKWPGDISVESIRGIALSSDIIQTGHFSSNNIAINRLINNSFSSQISCFVDVPIDSPSRDTRLGSLGDSLLFIRTACFNYDVQSFFYKWLEDMNFAQLKNGAIPNTVPDARHDNASSSGCGEACIIIPWQLYIRYGDINVLKKNYNMMKKYAEYCVSKTVTKHIISKGSHLGDKYSLDGVFGSSFGQTPHDLIATLYYYNSISILVNIAKVLKLDNDASEFKTLQNNIKVAFHKEFLTENGRLAANTQTAYTLALAFDILEGEAKKRAILELKTVVEKIGFITCGMLGSAHILDVLTDNGQHALAVKMALKTTYPSWLYPITVGAVTMWEGWVNSVPECSESLYSANSYNSYAYGSFANWYYEKVAGIAPDETSPGYKHFYLSPRPSTELCSVSAKLKTHYGSIEINYNMNIESSEVLITINIPDDTTCTLALDDCKAYTINDVRKKYIKPLLLAPGCYNVSYVKGGSFLSHVTEGIEK